MTGLSGGMPLFVASDNGTLTRAVGAAVDRYSVGLGAPGEALMRRWLAALVCTTALAGCTAGLPDGVDGDLTGGWHLPPAAVQWVPQVGACFDDTTETASPEDYAPMDCKQRHLVETYAVGEYKGPLADTAGTVRASGYRDCAKRADAFAGGQWRASRLVIKVVLPDEAGWTAGARWIRCDMAESDDNGLVGRGGSLRNALRTTPALLLRCFNPTISGDNVKAMAVVDCARPHHAEFAGLWAAPKIALTDLEGSPQLAKGCLSTIARYTGVPDDSMIKYRTGWLGFPGGDDAWTAGDRTVQCFLWLSGETMTGSYKGAGAAKLKVHYV
jgi:hypothetical protein